VELNGENVNGIPSYGRSQKGLIYLPQQHSVFMKATVFDNLFMVLEMYGPAGEARQKAMELLGDFGLLAVKDSKAHQLSGGEKRRLEIARSMIMAPRFLFMDEPFTGIDPITILDIQTILLKLKSRGIGIIITDHNVKDTFYITDLAYIIHKGHILSSGTPAQVVQEEKTRQVFLGKDFEWHG
jgi:lipopolysaccharide export system ATP-binding protein